MQALRARQLGINTVIVLEQIEELPLALEASARLRIRPALGVRGRLATHHKCAFTADCPPIGLLGTRSLHGQQACASCWLSGAIRHLRVPTLGSVRTDAA